MNKRGLEQSFKQGKNHFVSFFFFERKLKNMKGGDCFEDYD